MLGIFKSLFGKNSDETESGEAAAKNRLQKLRERKLAPPSATDAEDASASLRDLVQSKTQNHHEGVSPFNVWTGVEGKAHSLGIVSKAMVSPTKGGAFGYSENPLDDDIEQMNIEQMNKEGFAESTAKKKLQFDLSQSVLSSLIEKHGQIERNLDPEPGTASGSGTFSGQYDVVKDTVLVNDWASNESLFSGTGLYCDYGDTLHERPFSKNSSKRSPKQELTEEVDSESAEKPKCFGPPVDLNKLAKPIERRPAPVLDDEEFVEEVLFHYDTCESLFEEALEEDEEDDDTPVEIAAITATASAVIASKTVQPKTAAAAVQSKDAAAEPKPAAAPTTQPKPTTAAKPVSIPIEPIVAVPAVEPKAAVPAAAPKAAAPAPAKQAKPTPATKTGSPTVSPTKPSQSDSKPPAAKPNQSSNRLQAVKPTQTMNRLQAAAPARTEDNKKNLQLSDLRDSMAIKQFSHPYDKFSESSLKLLAQNPKTPSGALAWLAAHRNPHIRAAVAKNAATPIETFWVLARDHESSIRYSIAENLYMSPEILRELSRDRNPLIATTAQNALHSVRESLMNALPPSSLFSKKTTASGQSIEPVKQSEAETELQGDEEFLLMISRKTTTPARRLKELANHANAKIRAAVAENGNTPSDVLWLMARDADPNVKIKLAQNCNLPEEILDILKEDRDAMVAKAAHKMQTKLAGLRFTNDAGGNDIRHVITWS